MQIRNRWSGDVIYEAKAESLKDLVELAVTSGANLYRANLSGADLSGAHLYGAHLYGAHLYGAHLSGADLSGANLCKADLSGAHLYGANLSRANLSGANLSGAKGLVPEKCTPLLVLLEQPGKIRAYKLVNKEYEGPYNGGIVYEVGKSYEVVDANIDVNNQYGAGINLATLDWCLKEWQKGYRVLIAEFEAKDIAAIPTATDGKFRVHRCKIIGEKDVSHVVDISATLEEDKA